MTEPEFSILKNELKSMIDFLRNRGLKIGEIVDDLQEDIKLPKRWSSVPNHIDSLKFSKVNTDNIAKAHKNLASKIKNILLYNNKLIKVLNVNEESFSKLLNYFQESVNNRLKDYSIDSLINDTDTDVSFQIEMDGKKLAFYFKYVVNDYARVDIEDRVTRSLREEFSNIIGLKKVNFPALNSYTFDLENKVIIVSVDLAGIVKSSNLNVEMSNFSIRLKKTVEDTTFPDHSKNLFPKIKAFYDKSEGVANDLSLKTADGVIYHAHANKRHPDARESIYHKTGVKGVNGLINVFRIFMAFDTKRKTQYKIDLKSNAAMATKQKPELYEATIQADNATDFTSAINKIL